MIILTASPNAQVQDRKKFLASSLGMMSEDEKKTQRIEDIRELLS